MTERWAREPGHVMLSFRRARIQSGEVPRGQFPTCKLSTVRGAFQSVTQNAAILSPAPELDRSGNSSGTIWRAAD
jgi:hypothetical protein